MTRETNGQRPAAGDDLTPNEIGDRWAESQRKRRSEERRKREEYERLPIDQKLSQLIDNIHQIDPYRQPETDHHKRIVNCRDLIQRRGRRYARCTLDNFDPKTPEARQAQEALCKLASRLSLKLSKGEANIVLIGPTGTGKDHLLFAMMKHAIVECGFDVLWYDGLALFAELKQAIRNDKTADVINKAAKVPILAISDPISPRGDLSPYELDCLRDIVERRYSREMATWVTTNVASRDDAERLFSAAVLSRLIDGALELFISGDDYRRDRGIEA